MSTINTAIAVGHVSTTEVTVIPDNLEGTEICPTAMAVFIVLICSLE